MTDSTNYWTDLANQQLGRAAEPPEQLPQRIPDGAAPVAPLPGEGDPSHGGGVTLHPRMRLALDELLDSEGAQTHNLAILVGHVRRVPARRRRANDTRPRTDAAAGRYQITDYGVREDLFRLEIQEVAGDALDSAVMSYSMELSISHRLLESGLFEDGQRLAICGPLRMERTYDARFATAPTDPGRPDWTTKLEVLAMLPVDDATPDGSFVELIGVVEGAPRIRREMVGAGAYESFATVRLRCRRQLRSGISRSRAVFSTSTVLPLEAPLSGDLAQVGALLRAGNTVHVHGRLVQYRYQLPIRASANTTEGGARKGVQDVLKDVAATARARLSQRQPDADDFAFEREVRRAQQRFLTVIKPTIEVGYVELQHGTVLDEAEIAELIANWRPQPTSDRAAPHAEKASPARETVNAELDAATAAVFSPAPSETEAPDRMPIKPRRRARGDITPESDAAGEFGSNSDHGTDDAA